MIERLRDALRDRYDIDRELGAGGMATVYLASDLKHERKVAVKVLRPELSAVIGGERFLTEIRTTANLQHPHILPLFDSGEADGLLYYVMPYVEGESLRDRLDRDRQLPVDEAVRMTVAIASALDYAHRQGVIHRDIKPANILLHDGQPIVADFGIALAVSAAGGGRMTETGLSLGTPHYMSPEQASADRDLNAQSDVYALACVLYEMLAGQPPFTGGSAQSVLMQILTEEARPLTRSRKSVPANVEAAVARALEKLPADRFATAADFAAALRNPDFRNRSETAGAEDSTSSRRRRSIPVWPAVATLAALAAAIGWFRPIGDVEQPLLRLGVPVDLPLLPRFDDGAIQLDVQEDGRAIVYASQGAGGELAVQYRRLDRLEERTIFEGGVTAVSISPDGEDVLVLQGTRLYLVPVNGGTPRLIEEAVNRAGPLWAWNGDVFYNDANGRLIRREGGVDGERQILYTPEPGGPIPIQASPLPDERHLVTPLLSGRAGGVSRTAVVDTESGEIVRTFDLPAARLVGDDMLAWIEGASIRAQRFDADRLEPVGPIVSEDSGLDGALNGYQGFTVSPTGTLVYHVSTPVVQNIVRIDRNGSRQRLVFSAPTELGFRLSPDGRRLVFDERFIQGAPDVYTLDLELGTRTRLTYEGDAIYPVWHPSGDRIAYYRVIDGEYALYIRNADGTGAEEVLLDADANEIEVVFVPGTDRIIVRQGDRAASADSDIWEYTVGDPESGRPIARDAGNQVAPAVSPEGRFVAYASDETGGWQIYVRSLANPNERWQVSADGGIEPMWNPQGTELFYRRAGTLLSVPIDLTSTFRQTGPAEPLFEVPRMLSNNNHSAYQVSPDGQSFYFTALGDGRLLVTLNWIDHVHGLLEDASR